jgi:hypothetical protein
MLIETRQELPEDTVGTRHGGGASQAQFGHQPVLKRPRHSFNPALRLRASGKYLAYPQFA